MTRNLDILNELKELSQAVADITHQTPYQLPAVYFETLPEVILAGILAGSNEESAIVTPTGKQLVYDVPEGYFENLSHSILSKIKNTEAQAEEIDSEIQSPLLNSISKTNVYEVPDGYFDSLPGLITAKTNKKAGEATIVSFSSRRTWVRFAAAAAVLVMIVTGAYYLSNTSGPMQGVVAQGLRIQTEEQFNTALAQIETAEVVNYLKTTAIDLNEEAIQTIMNDTELPEETDYLDEEFLDTYLNELENPETVTTN